MQLFYVKKLLNINIFFYDKIMIYILWNYKNLLNKNILR